MPQHQKNAVAVQPESDAITMETGIQPVQMELPRVGKPYYFERYLVPEGTDLVLEVRQNIVQAKTKWIFVLRAIVLLFGLLVATQLLRNPTLLMQINATLAVIIITITVRYCGMTFLDYVGWLLLGVILAVILSLSRALVLFSKES